MASWVIALLILGGIALVYSALMTLQAWENRRFIRSRLKHRAETAALADTSVRVLVIVPCKGLDLELEENLRAILDQDYPHPEFDRPNYEVRFVVESADDPACETIRTLLDDRPNDHVPCRMLVAGRSVDCGQKVHNLRAATAEIPSQVEILGFLDSDARPSRGWLRALVQRLQQTGAGAVTGYRWFVPKRPTLANMILYSLNSGVAGLFGPGDHHLVWGGSWAIRRDMFEATAMRDAWQGTLSDDLVASRVLRGANLGVVFEPACMNISPLDVTGAGMFEFVRRQYTIGRSYVPRWWTSAMIANLTATLACWCCLIGGTVAAFSGESFAWLLSLDGLALYGLAALRAWLHQDSGRRYIPDFPKIMIASRRFCIWANPFVALINAAGLVSSLLGRTVTWRGIRYHLSPGGHILLLGRRPPASPKATVLSKPAVHRSTRPVEMRPASEMRQAS